MRTLFYLGIAYVIAVVLVYGGTRLALARPEPCEASARGAEPVTAEGPELAGRERKEAWWKLALISVGVLAALSLSLAGLGQLSRHGSVLPVFFGLVNAWIAVQLAYRYMPALGARIVVAGVLVACVLVWFFDPFWFTADLVAVIAAVGIMGFVQPGLSFLKLAVIAVVVAFGYDLVQVFLTHSMSQYASTGLHQSLPIMIAVPASLYVSAPVVTALGVGDVAFPAILIVMAGQIGQQTGNPWMYRAAYAGYATGLAVALVTLMVTKTDLPALIFVIPGVIAGVCAAVWRARDWSSLTRLVSVNP